MPNFLHWEFWKEINKRSGALMPVQSGKTEIKQFPHKMTFPTPLQCFENDQIICRYEFNRE